MLYDVRCRRCGRQLSTEKGNKLRETFDELTDYGDKMWLMDLAVMQIDKTEIHDLVYEALSNPDLAKRIGFKKLFIEHMLGGNAYKHDYDEIAEEYEAELRELNRFDEWEMSKAFDNVMDARGMQLRVRRYPYFARYLVEKVQGLKLTGEVALIAECRAHLTAYDDFIFGLRVNQALHERQEQTYKQQMAALQAAYDEKLKLLLLAAERVGLFPALQREIASPEFLPLASSVNREQKVIV